MRKKHKRMVQMRHPLTTIILWQLSGLNGDHCIRGDGNESEHLEAVVVVVVVAVVVVVVVMISEGKSGLT